MAGIDEKFIEELKSKNNIVDVIGRYAVLKRKGSNYWACCPLPGHTEKTPSFSINEQGQFYKCFGCGKGGDVIRFIQEVETLDFYDAIKLLAERSKMTVPENNNYDEEQTQKLKQKKDRLYDVLKDTAYFYVNNLKLDGAKESLNYLAKRGITPSTLRAFGMGVSLGFNELPLYLKSKGYLESEMLESGVCQKNSQGNLFDAEAGRIIVPIINQMGKVIAFGGRVIKKTNDNIGKYKNTQETVIFSKKKTLFAINNLKKLKLESDIDSVIMVEGYMDAISLYQAGFKNVVASMGTSLTLEQAKLLKRYTNKVIVSFDGDSAGQKATVRSLNIFADEGFDIRVLNLPNGKDPDDVIRDKGKDFYQKLIDEAEPLIDFKLRIIGNGKNLKDTADRRQYVKESLELIKTVSDAFMREELLKKLRDRSGITYESLKRDLESGNLSTTEEVVDFKVPTVKSDNNAKAERFVLLSIIKGRPYATDYEELYFSNETRNKVLDKILDGDDVKIEDLCSYVLESELVELNEILVSGDNVFDKPFEEKYFKDCMSIIKRSNLEEEIKVLNVEYKNETDTQKRREIADLILKKTTKLSQI